MKGWSEIPEKLPSKGFAEIMSEQYVDKINNSEHEELNRVHKKDFVEEYSDVVNLSEEEQLRVAIENSLRDNDDNSGVVDSDYLIALNLQEEENSYLYEKPSFQDSQVSNKITVVSSDDANLTAAYRNIDFSDNQDIASYVEDDEGIATAMKLSLQSKGRTPAWPRRNKNLKGQGGNDEIITKHDSKATFKKNLDKINNNININVGENADFLENEKNLKMPNHVFNQLHKFKEKSKASTNDFGQVFAKQLNVKTILKLQSLMNSGYINSISGILKNGKEGMIFYASGNPYTDINQDVSDLLSSLKVQSLYVDEYAVKIFKLNIVKQGHFKYKKNIKNFEVLKCEKEFRNLCKLNKYGIPSPIPLKCTENIVIMTFLGRNGWSAKTLKEVNKLSYTSYLKLYFEVCLLMKAMFVKCKLVHCDLSEYNILYHRKHCYIIDVCQAISTSQEDFAEYLLRDCENIITFFDSRGIREIISAKELFSFIVHDAAYIKTHSKVVPVNLVVTCSLRLKKLSWVDESFFSPNDIPLLFNTPTDLAQE